VGGVARCCRQRGVARARCRERARRPRLRTRHVPGPIGLGGGGGRDARGGSGQLRRADAHRARPTGARRRAGGGGTFREALRLDPESEGAQAVWRRR
jgi:hypothetical protein